jgi:hypothetical protein
MCHSYKIGDRIRIINTTNVKAKLGELGIVVQTAPGFDNSQHLEVRFFNTCSERNPVWNSDWVLSQCVVLADK